MSGPVESDQEPVMTDTATPSAEPLRDLPRGRFSGRETFQQLVRDAIATAARDGWQEASGAI